MNKTIEDKLNEGRQYRNIEVRALAADDDAKIVEGYATTFNDPYQLFSFDDYEVNEQVDRHAFDGADLSDVIMQYDHQGRVFARTGNDTLQLSVDDHGLKIRANLGGTEMGRQLYEEIRGGYTTKMSFGFTVKTDERIVTEDHDRNKTVVLRTIKEIGKLYDVSAVSLPANDATSISARSYGEGVIAELAEERRKSEERRRQIQRIKILTEVI